MNFIISMMCFESHHHLDCKTQPVDLAPAVFGAMFLSLREKGHRIGAVPVVYTTSELSARVIMARFLRISFFEAF